MALKMQQDILGLCPGNHITSENSKIRSGVLTIFQAEAREIFP